MFLPALTYLVAGVISDSSSTPAPASIDVHSKDYQLARLVTLRVKASAEAQKFQDDDNSIAAQAFSRILTSLDNIIVQLAPLKDDDSDDRVKIAMIRTQVNDAEKELKTLIDKYGDVKPTSVPTKDALLERIIELKAKANRNIEYFITKKPAVAQTFQQTKNMLDKDLVQLAKLNDGNILLKVISVNLDNEEELMNSIIKSDNGTSLLF